MNLLRFTSWPSSCSPPRAARATDPYAEVATAANEKLVKLFGAGGYRGAESFGTGIVVSPQGHILTVAAPFLDGRDLRLHLPDGRKYAFKVKVIEPEFDAAIVQIEQPKKEKDVLPLDLPYFDVVEAARAMHAEPGTWVMALSNMYKVAERDEMMSVQRAMITAVGKLSARRGQFEVPYHGDVLYLDTITNNPGAAGGAVIDRKGNLLGMIGKEFRNNQTDTWVNYAMPLNTKADVTIKGEKKTFTLAEFVDLAIHDKWVKSGPEGGRPGHQEPAGVHGHHLRPEGGGPDPAVHRGGRAELAGGAGRAQAGRPGHLPGRRAGVQHGRVPGPDQAVQPGRQGAGRDPPRGHPDGVQVDLAPLPKR